jgi:hypothetical protein
LRRIGGGFETGQRHGTDGADRWKNGRGRTIPRPAADEKPGGRIYQQTFVDTYSKVAMAKLYTTKTPITAADLLRACYVLFVARIVPAGW